MNLATLDAAAREAYGIDSGVGGAVVTGVDAGSPAAEKGPSAGAVLVSVARSPVRSVADVTRRIDEAKEDGDQSRLIRVRTHGDGRTEQRRVGEGWGHAGR